MPFIRYRSLSFTSRKMTTPFSRRFDFVFKVNYRFKLCMCFMYGLSTLERTHTQTRPDTCCLCKIPDSNMTDNSHPSDLFLGLDLFSYMKQGGFSLVIFKRTPMYYITLTKFTLKEFTRFRGCTGRRWVWCLECSNDSSIL